MLNAVFVFNMAIIHCKDRGNIYVKHAQCTFHFFMHYLATNAAQ